MCSAFQRSPSVSLSLPRTLPWEGSEVKIWRQTPLRARDPSGSQIHANPHPVDKEVFLENDLHRGGGSLAVSAPVLCLGKGCGTGGTKHAMLKTGAGARGESSVWLVVSLKGSFLHTKDGTTTSHPPTHSSHQYFCSTANIILSAVGRKSIHCSCLF